MMADQMEEPPQKRMKVDDFFLLEENLPDELVNTWGDQLGAGGGGGGGGGAPNHGMGVNVGGVGGPNKPPAQGPGPGVPGGPPQLNGSMDDVNTGGVVGGTGPGGNPLRQMQHHQHLQHLLQQQVLLINLYFLQKKKYLNFLNSSFLE